MRSASNTSKALRRARSARAAAASGSSRTRAMASARATGSRGGTSSPSAPSSRTSRQAPTSLATTGTPGGHGLDQGDAQALVRGGGEDEQVELADQLGHVAAHAEQPDAIARGLRAAISASSSRRRLPSPISQTSQSRPRRRSRPAARISVGWSLCASRRATMPMRKREACALPAGRAGARGEGGDRHAIVDHGGLAGVDAEARDHAFLDVAAAADERRRGGPAELDLGAELVEGGAASWSDSCRHARPRGGRRRAGRRRP